MRDSKRVLKKQCAATLTQCRLFISFPKWLMQYNRSVISRSVGKITKHTDKSFHLHGNQRARYRMKISRPYII